jgi:hypothetical protein
LTTWPVFQKLCEYFENQRFIVRADEKLTAFVGFESATRGCGELACQAEIKGG